MENLEDLFISPLIFCKYIEKCNIITKIDNKICFENIQCKIYKFYEKYGVNYKRRENEYKQDGYKGVEGNGL